MKITQVAVEVVRVPVERPYLAGGRTVDANWHVLARITTSDGVEGVGYIVYPRPDLMTTIAAAARELGEHLVGMSVLEPEAAWEKLARRGDWVGPGGLLHCALAPLDIAVWDANGKTLGQPLHRLLGGYRDRLPTYASDGLWYSLSPADLAASARRHVDDGFTGVKLRLGREATPHAEVRRVEAVREAVGPDVRIMVDINECWSQTQARRGGRALQDAGIAWLEDPVHHLDVAGLADLRRELQVPIAAGEHIYHLDGFRTLLEARAVDVVILDLARVGGVTPWRKIAAIAQAHRVPVCGHVVPEIQVHLLASVPNGHMVEYVPRSAGILTTMPRIEQGELVAPSGPGLGLELDDAAVRRHRVA
ncbi:MAG TPA: mandelate racemase/muconate lactonizing enzyme family protein [Candidatus Acidoferrum sp.]|jgi:L-alanine-DL-glutamate epimerase-like enolase superfamily enzyme|nr:mandelate racemase/muconate lactonizing enzyme family protein [Candidatus Acidoferrum sp.]